VIDASFAIACGEGAIRPLAVQREGRAALALGDFLRGSPVSVGTVAGT
jgi:methionyl-tRNA formyltransferase